MSVVVPTRNAGNTLAQLLRSLAAQDLDGGYEVIVVDDGSTDASVAVAKAWEQDLPLRLCEIGSRRGAAAARNAGAASASAPILAFCDADDIAHEAWLRSLLHATHRHRLVAGGVHRLTGNLRDPTTSPPSGPPADPVALNGYYDHLPWSMTANLAVRRDVFAAVGGFTENLATAHDADLCWRLAACGVSLGYEPDAIIFKRPRCGALRTFRQYLHYGVEHPLLYRMHRDRGMPRRSLPQAARRYAGSTVSISRAVRHPRSPALLQAAARTGQDLGRIIGSVRWRSLYL